MPEDVEIIPRPEALADALSVFTYSGFSEGITTAFKDRSASRESKPPLPPSSCGFVQALHFHHVVVHKGVIKEVLGDGTPPIYEELAIEAILHPLWQVHSLVEA
jgi:hypothetical protein